MSLERSRADTVFASGVDVACTPRQLERRFVVEC